MGGIPWEEHFVGVIPWEELTFSIFLASTLTLLDKGEPKASLMLAADDQVDPVKLTDQVKLVTCEPSNTRDPSEMVPSTTVVYIFHN